DDKAVLVGKGQNESPLPRALVSDPKKLSLNYEFVDLGYGRITGRHCRFIGIKPKDGYRYGYRICIDKTSGLPLKSELVDENGAAIEQVMFTRLIVGELIDDSLLVSKVDATNFKWLVQNESKPGAGLAARRWVAKEVPPGFEIPPNGVQIIGEGENAADHVIFSDGLASVSVFAEPSDASKAGLEGLSNIGAVNAFGTRVGNHNITVVGEVPSATVELIARSIEFVATDQP
ncbi:MAG: MucB/RseB C-terminal domain-containing protein, partial [Gammaproteobacteria bacterium]